MKITSVCVFLTFAMYCGATNKTVPTITLNNLTEAELRAIQKLRPLVAKHLYQEYMNNDHYLVRFLRAQKLNVPLAKEMLLKSIVWRKQNNMDTVLEEKLEIEKAMPYDLTADLEGRPVGSVRVGEWKVRHFLLAGKRDDVIRVVYKYVELAMYKYREASIQTGKNITNGVGIADMNGFSLREHTCLLCMQVYFELLSQYEMYYPQVAYKIFAINTPRIFQSVYNVIKPVLSQYTIDTVEIYGFDKSEWRQALLKLVANDQLPTYIGGTYTSDNK